MLCVFLIHVRHWPTSLCLQKVYCFSFLQVLPYPVYFHSATVTPSGCMYVFGGVKTLNSNEDTRSNDIFKLWLTLPSLVDRCWEVVTNCFQDKRTLLADAMQMGIPQHFLERLKWTPHGYYSFWLIFNLSAKWLVKCQIFFWQKWFFQV